MAEVVKKLASRTCIACRHENVKDKMLRFVLGPERNIVPDLAARLPGRGAYTCPDPACVKAAVQRRQFSRTFKVEFVGTNQGLIAEITGLFESKLLSLLTLANKAGGVVSGGDSVERALSSLASSGILWIAADASKDRQEKYTFLATRAGCTVHVGSTSVELGRLLGKEQRTFLLLKPSGIAAKLGNELERFRKFIDGGAQEP